MSVFKYRPSPKPGGGLRTRAILGPQVSEAALTGAVATAAGITPPQAELAIKAFFNQLLALAADGQWSDGLYDLVGFRPTSGGSGTTPDDFTTPESINADVRVSFTAATIEAWWQTLTLESQGEVGLRTPVIDKVVNLKNDLEDEYTVGDMIRLRGDDLRIDKADLGQGIFLRKSDGTEVRVSVYGSNEPGQLDGLIPAGLTGALGVRVVASIFGALRSGTYVNNISASI